jgi:hypothetical protein
MAGLFHSAIEKASRVLHRRRLKPVGRFFYLAGATCPTASSTLGVGAELLLSGAEGGDVIACLLHRRLLADVLTMKLLLPKFVVSGFNFAG